MKMRLKLFTALLMFSLGPTKAQDISIIITGEITIPPCTINSNANIDVDFGNVSVMDVANVDNIKTFSVPVNCTYYEGTPYVKVIGTQLSGAASNILATDINDFGIALYQGESTKVPMILGDGESAGKSYFLGYPIQPGVMSVVNQASGQFTFTAVPYQLGTKLLPAGAFAASASISISYQ